MSKINRFDFCNFLTYDFSNDFGIYEIGKHACPPSYSYGPVIRSRCIFHYVLSGEGTLHINNHTFHISANQGFFIPAGVLAFYQADAENPWTYAWIHVDGPKVTEVFKNAGLSIDQPVFSPTGDTYILDALMFDLLENSHRELYCIGKVYEIFDYILAYSPQTVVPESNRKMQYVKKIINYIQIKYSEPIHVSDIAHACGLERSYLTKMFKEVTGYSLHDYLLSYRMKIACKALENENCSIQYVAYSVGYSDAFTFSKAFKRYFHISPSEYREQNKTRQK